MIPTTEYIEKRFREFNHLIFDDKLPKLPIQLSRARSFVGVLAYKKRREIYGKETLFDFRLRISMMFDLPEREWEDTIIHEMIHYYIGINDIKDTSSHGVVFMKLMNNINQRFGRNIMVTHYSTPEQKQQLADTSKRWHVVAVVKFHDGRSGIKVLPHIRQRITAYRNSLLMNREIKSVDLFITNDHYFNAYPNSSALRVHILAPSEYEHHLQKTLPERELTINNSSSASS